MPSVTPDFVAFDRSIDGARVMMSLLAMLSVYVDPSAGGLFHLDKWLFATLLCHLFYSSVAYLASSAPVGLSWIRRIATGLDLAFATAIAFLTEGRTSPSFVFFVFSIVAVGFRTGFRNTLAATLSSVALYLAVLSLSSRLGSVYAMRAVYLAIAGYLIGFFGRQRAAFETQLRELEAAAERQSIARSLHDGYIQSLGAVTLRLESCRDMLVDNEIEHALSEIQEIQVEVTNEYDEVRDYLRSLAGLERPGSKGSTAKSETEFRVSASFTARGVLIEHIMQIMFEGIRNTRRHSHAGSASVKVDQTDAIIRITIDDNGVGLAECPHPPWTIASRVTEFGGRLAIKKADGLGAHIEIALPLK